MTTARRFAAGVARALSLFVLAVALLCVRLPEGRGETYEIRIASGCTNP